LFLAILAAPLNLNARNIIRMLILNSTVFNLSPLHGVKDAVEALKVH
jgi:hypothetical protein